MANPPTLLDLTAGDAVPRPNQSLFLTKYGVDLNAGAFIHLTLPHLDPPKQVFRMLRRVRQTSGLKAWLCQRFPPMFEDNADPGMEGLHFQPIVEAPTCYLKEVYASNLGYIFTSNYLKNSARVVFLFTQHEVLSSGTDWIRGSNLCYVIRHAISISSNETAPPIVTSPDALHITPFPSRLISCRYTTCYPLRVWLGQCQIQLAVSKILNCSAESQGEADKKTDTFFLEKSVWNFFKDYFESISPVHKTKGVKTLFVMQENCKRKKLAVDKEMNTYRFSTDEQLEALDKIFGDVFRVGVRTNKPTKKKPLSDFQTTDAINAVIGSPVTAEDGEAPPFIRYTHQPGIDFVYDDKGFFLSTTVRYQKFIYRTDGRLMNCHNEEITSNRISYLSDFMVDENALGGVAFEEHDDVEDQGNNILDLLVVGGQFAYAGCLWEISQLMQTTTVCVCQSAATRYHSYSIGDLRTFSNQEVADAREESLAA
jgi:hypothetical protein